MYSSAFIHVNEEYSDSLSLSGRVLDLRFCLLFTSQSTMFLKFSYVQTGLLGNGLNKY